MNFNQIVTVYLKELRDALRDRRTIVSMFIVPTLVIPIIILGFGVVTAKIIRKARAETPGVMLLGAKDSPEIRAALAAHPRIRIVPTRDDFRTLISNKTLRAAVELPDDFDAALVESRPSTVRLYTYDGEIKSGFATGELDRFFRDYREKAIQTRLSERGLPAALVRPYEITRQNVAPPEKVGGNLVGGFIPYVIILLCFTGAMYPAMDLTAGEKERGTLETLLCSPVGRTEIVLGKFLVVLTSALSTVVLAGISAMATFPLGALLFAPEAGPARAVGSAAVAAARSPMPQIDPLGFLASLAMVAPIAVLFSAGLLALSLFAKSYKEAQSYVSPLIVVIILPALSAMLPGVELNLQLSLIPILNVSLVCKELVSGIFHWGHLSLIFASSCVYAAIALALAVRMFNRESVLFRT
ncbi:MAG: ABC transporter permease [Opitutaceae bacterium]